MRKCLTYLAYCFAFTFAIVIAHVSVNYYMSPDAILMEPLLDAGPFLMQDKSDRAARKDPPRLTGGSGPTSSTLKPAQDRQSRKIPDVTFTEPPEGYATLLAHGWDKWEMQVNWHLSMEFQLMLEREQARAQKLNDGNGGKVPIRFNDDVVQLWAWPSRQAGGAKWVLEHEFYQVRIAHPAGDFQTRVIFTAKALWMFGLREMDGRVTTALSSHGTFPTQPATKISRCDYAVDFHCPALTPEMQPGIAANVVCHSSTKVSDHYGGTGWSKGMHQETLTIGKYPGLEVAVYDKSRAISDLAGTDWMQAVWAREGYLPPGKPRDVWRIEARFGSDYFKARGLRPFHEVVASRCHMMAEALVNRRLVVPQSGDSNRWRWPVHPFWTAAWRVASQCDEMPPLGRVYSKQRDALLDDREAQFAGSIRSATVLELGGRFDEAAARVFVERAMQRMLNDPRHRAKIDEAIENQRFIDRGPEAA